MKKYMLMGSLLALSTAAVAQEGSLAGLYIGVNAGQSSIDVSHDDIDAIAFDAFSSNGFGVLSASSTLDDSDTVFSGVIGYRFSKHFALEVGYVALGEVSYRATGLVNPPGPVSSAAASLDLNLSVKGPTAGLVLNLPLGNRFDFHGRAGAFFAKVSTDVAISVGGVSEAAGVSSSSVDPYFGAGFSWIATDKLSLSVDFTRYQNVGDEDETGEGSVDAITAGLLYRF